MKPSSTFFEDLSRVAGGAASALSEIRDQVVSQKKAGVDRLMAGLDVVSRAEFDDVAAMAANARQEQAALAKRLATLEAKLGISSAKKPAIAKTAPKKKTPTKKRTR